MTNDHDASPEPPSEPPVARPASPPAVGPAVGPAVAERVADDRVGPGRRARGGDHTARGAASTGTEADPPAAAPAEDPPAPAPGDPPAEPTAAAPRTPAWRRPAWPAWRRTRASRPARKADPTDPTGPTDLANPADAPAPSLRTAAPPPSFTRSPFESETFTSATFVATSHAPYIALACVWVFTRLGMLVLLWRDNLGIGGVGREVYVLYRIWYDRLAHGTFPPDDPTWQYPPGAGLVIGSPAALPWLTYFQAFVALALLADAVVAAALARADSARVTHGAWVWVCGLPLLLHIPLARYDVQVTAIAVLALLALRSRPAIGGALAGLGALVKVWPALTLIGTPRGRTTREAWLAAASTAAALMLTLGVLFTNSLDFLRQQGGRGVQIESLGGTALSLAGAAGLWPGRVEYRYGAFEYVGPYVSSVGLLALLLTGAAFCWLMVWRMKARRWTAATPLDAAFAAVLLFTLTSRVISPQYMVWLLGLAAVCLTSRETVMRPAVLLLLPATALSALAYPVLYEDVLAGTPIGLAVMTARNGLLLAAGLLACRGLWRATVRRPVG
ncbi:glycosyltransferase 87 family protein [Streptomyces sp. NPDC048629]|uniref:glycosyltransferase 87 family protein n=1 Tax=Streptomyces sp. NPDC048629 TaxID=3154824 RepID=UPI003421C144